MTGEEKDPRTGHLLLKQERLFPEAAELAEGPGWGRGDCLGADPIPLLEAPARGQGPWALGTGQWQRA